MDVVFTLYYPLYLKKITQGLTVSDDLNFSFLVKEGVSYLQLFLGFPETIWSLQNTKTGPNGQSVQVNLTHDLINTFGL